MCVCVLWLQSYGVCSVGLQKLWLLVMVYGLSSSCCSALSLCLLRLPRHLTLLGGAFLHLGVIVGLMCWSPTPMNGHAKPPVSEPLPVLLVLTALWGLGTALNKTSLSCELESQPQSSAQGQGLALAIVYSIRSLPSKNLAQPFVLSHFYGRMSLYNCIQSYIDCIWFQVADLKWIEMVVLSFYFFLNCFPLLKRMFFVQCINLEFPSCSCFFVLSLAGDAV